MKLSDKPVPPTVEMTSGVLLNALATKAAQMSGNSFESFVEAFRPLIAAHDADADASAKEKRIWCMNCGKSVSSPVPKGTVVRAYVECPECIAKRGALRGWEKR
jgi:DNA-directed RNA polymerase subunit RPC12/RpoP